MPGKPVPFGQTLHVAVGLQGQAGTAGDHAGRETHREERPNRLTRRSFIKLTGTAGWILWTTGVAAPGLAQGAKIEIGYISPQTGPLPSCSESDAFNVQAFHATEAGANSKAVGKDSQTNPNRAAEVASGLILRDEVSMTIVAFTQGTTNPVTTVCENEGVPVASTVAPWQPRFIGQQGNLTDLTTLQKFDCADHSFRGLEDLIAVFASMWSALPRPA